MARRVSIVLLVVAAVCCTSGPQDDRVARAEHDAKVKEAASLQAEVERLKAVVEDLQHGPARQLAEALAALEAKDFDRARSAAQGLVSKYPTSPEVGEARAVIGRAESAIRASEAAAQQARAQAMAGMVKKRDDMRNLTVWRDRAMPAYVNSRSWVGAYVMAPDGGRPHLRFVIYYKADDWLFIERYLFKVDGRDVVFEPGRFGADAIERDNGYGGIWEWWDVTAEGDRFALLHALAEAKAATIRYEGRQYRRDRQIDSSERAAIKRTLVAFDLLSKGS